MRRGLEPVNDPRYPDRVGPMAQPRRPKHFVGKDGQAATYVHQETPFDDQPDIDAARAEQPGQDGTAPTEPQQPDQTSGTAPRGRRGRTTPADQPADATSEGK